MKLVCCYVWISVLIDSYESVFTNALLDMGYTVRPACDGEDANKKDKLLSYRLSHENKSIEGVEVDMHTIVNGNSLKCHSCIISVPYAGGFDARWWGSNIKFDENKKTSSMNVPPISKPIPNKNQDIEDVVAHMHHILDKEGARIREARSQS